MPRRRLCAHVGCDLQVPVMVRVEVEKAQRLQFQVTVASTDGNTTSSLKDAICQLLSKL